MTRARILHRAPHMEGAARATTNPDDRASGVRAFEGVEDYLCWHHGRLDALLDSVDADVAAGRLGQARDSFDAYDAGMRRHMRIEEELLFPVFEARTGVASGPTEGLRSEHRDIERALGIMGEGLRLASLERFGEGRRFLDSTLPDHHHREERILYPTLDRLLSETERGAVVERMLRE